MISFKLIKEAVFSLLAVTFAMSSAFAADDKPNFIIILADDLGYGDVGFTGSTEIKTPHIDALAKSGVIFEQGYVSAPVCGPSRAGLMTGRNQVNFGFDNNNVKPGPQYNHEYFGLPITEQTIADRLAKQGYVNGMIGKWHLGDEAHFKAPKRKNGVRQEWHLVKPFCSSCHGVELL